MVYIYSSNIYLVIGIFFLHENKKVSEYDQEIPQLHPADQPTAP